MLTNGRLYRSPERHGLQDAFGLRILLAFFSNRVLRGGPRILVQLAACFTLLMLGMRFMPHGLSGAALGTTSSLWNWTTEWKEEKIEIEEEEDDGGMGGLRIVVFGEDDIAIPARTHGGRGGRYPGWTEVLCEELNCSRHLSFIPPVDPTTHPMVSNDLYAAAIEQLLNETIESDKPGQDFNFQAEKFPVPWELPDLSSQVSAFLSTEKPRHPPNDTLWVFTFGTWDTWSLASVPIGISRPIIGAMVNHLFEQVERLYQSALDEDSVAWSGAISDDAQSDSSKVAAAGGEVTAIRKRAEMFRILVPVLFDPSLTPGWKIGRPELPRVHSSAEQMRNAAALTDDWNIALRNKLGQWVRTPNPRPKEADANATESTRNTDGNEFGPGQGSASQRKPPSIDSRDKPKSVSNTTRYPLRDGISYDLTEYLLSAIVERQFRNAGMHDSNGIGTKPTEEGYLEVWTPCINKLSEQEEDESSDNLESAIAKTKRKRYVSASRQRGEAVEKEALKECEAPHERLFFTPFTVAPRAVGDIAREAADLVRANKTIRSKWVNIDVPTYSLDG
ncbi:hypothetical protein B0T22DRAFT_384325 [Podospora appendiculata]|uniref:Uncharacterized protein n=1 Tax=Podospora appendiculata TaxID=314037 RepID=A0AAE0X1Y7_9PEZI|nr:hypothetical protein B0T22DRAFT_384325 [Podospora appendiculata]